MVKVQVPPQSLTLAIERAARALCYLHGAHPNEPMGGGPTWWHYVPEVQTVLQAVRDPSGGMSCAGVENLTSKCGREVSPEELEATWRVMVDAALSE